MSRHNAPPQGPIDPVADSMSALRQRAEERVATTRPPDLQALSPTATQRLLHDLYVQQIELEMQNEELRRTQAVLEASQARYLALYDMAPVGYVTLNQTGVIVEANRRAATLLGVPRNALLAQPLTHFIFPADQDVHYRHCQDLLATAEPQAYELRMVRPGGLPFWVGVEVAIRPSEASTAPVYHVTMSDISARKQAEEQLQQRMAQLRLVIDHVPVRIAYIDQDMRYRFVNKHCETWHEIPAAAFIGQTVEAILGTAAYDVLQPSIALALAGQRVTTEQRLPSRRGGVDEVRVHYVPHVLGHGEVAGFFSLIEDITEHKRLETRLLQTQKLEAVGMLAGGIAHDFNNILASVFVYAELIMNAAPPDSTVWHDAEAILQAGERASALVRQLLHFGQQTEATRHPIALHQMLHEVLSLLRASLPTAITLRQHLDAGWVSGDPAQIHQVVMNLCVNAGQAMRGRSGLVEIRLEAITVTAAFAVAHPPLLPGPCMCLTVRDTGEGMSAAVMAHIFEPFFTTKGVGKGTGLGLAVAHGIVTKHGGVITVTSVPAQGTTFAVYLPAVPEPATERLS